MASRILLADDSITIQKVVNLTFADEGIEVVAVSNGEMAERRLSEIKPDLVLADIFMPGKNGYELCQFIKESPHYRHVPVVLLVGAFEPFDQIEARRVRADAHLTKPFESRTLVETVRKLIETSRPPAPVRFTPSAQPLGQQQGIDAAGLEPQPDFPLLNVEVASAPEPWSASETAGNGEIETPLSVEAEYLDSALPEADSALSASEEPFSIDYTPADQPSGQVDFGGTPVFEAGAAELGNPFETSPADFASEADANSAPASDENTGFEVPSLFEVSNPDAAFDFERVEPTSAQDLSNVLSFEIDQPGETASDNGFAVLAESDSESARPPVEVGFDLHSPTAFEVSFGPIESSAVAGEAETVFDESGQGEPLEESFGVYDVSGSAPVAPPAATDMPDSPVSSEVESVVADSVAQTGAGFVSPPQPAVEAATVAPEAEMDADGATETGRQDEEARFAPLDLEGAARLASAEPEFATEETGFEVAEVVAEEGGFAIVPTAEAEQADVDEAGPPLELDLRAITAEQLETAMSAVEPDKERVEVAPEPSELTATPELPQVVIDEIVRRVVSQLSDAVVREVAWEVVPDCVERVVEKITRDSAARKL